jgi:hypothetical protein
MKRPAAAPDERPDRDLFDDPDLIEFTSRLPEARKVSIKVMNTVSGNWRHKGTMGVDIFNLDAVQQRYGGGTYQFSIHSADGRLLKTISNIEIDDPADSDEREPEAKPAAAAVTGLPAVSELTLMREQMAADRLLMMELIRGLTTAKPQPQSDIAQLVSALSTLKSMEPKHGPTPEVQDLLFKSFTSGLELAAKVSKATSPGETSPFSELIGLAREVFQEARPIIAAAIAKQTGAPGTTISPEIEMDGADVDLQPALNFVKEQLNAGLPPDALANVVLMQMQSNPDLDETVSTLIVEQDIESFLAIDPELSAEPLRTRFGQFFGVMRARILEARDSGGDTGDTANAGSDAIPNVEKH